MPGFDSVVEKYRVNGLPNSIVATERKRHIGYATRHQRAGKVLLDEAGCLDEVHGVIVVFFYPGTNREYIGIEDDVVGIEADSVHQQVVAALLQMSLRR